MSGKLLDAVFHVQRTAVLEWRQGKRSTAELIKLGIRSLPSGVDDVLNQIHMFFFFSVLFLESMSEVPEPLNAHTFDKAFEFWAFYRGSYDLGGSVTRKFVSFFFLYYF